MKKIVTITWVLFAWITFSNATKIRQGIQKQIRSAAPKLNDGEILACKCPLKYYEISSLPTTKGICNEVPLKICQRCAPGCAQCIGPQPTDCLQCLPTYYTHYHSNNSISDFQPSIDTQENESVDTTGNSQRTSTGDESHSKSRRSSFPLTSDEALSSHPYSTLPPPPLQSNHSNSEKLFQEEELLQAIDDVTNNTTSGNLLKKETLLQQVLIMDDSHQVDQPPPSKEIITSEEDSPFEKDEQSSGMIDIEESTEMKGNWAGQEHHEAKESDDKEIILHKSSPSLNSFPDPNSVQHTTNRDGDITGGDSIQLNNGQNDSEEGDDIFNSPLEKEGIIFDGSHNKLSQSTTQEKELISPEELDYHALYDTHDPVLKSEQDTKLDSGHDDSAFDIVAIHKNVSLTDSYMTTTHNFTEVIKDQKVEQSGTSFSSSSIPTFICVQFCPHGFYADEYQRTCRTCHSECAGCYGAGPDNCSECQNYKLGSSCVLSCNVSDGVTAVGDSECVVIIEDDDDHSIPAIYYAVPPIVITITAAWLLFIHYRRKRKMASAISWQAEGMRRGDVVKKHSCEHLQQAHNDHKKCYYKVNKIPCHIPMSELKNSSDHQKKIGNPYVYAEKPLLPKYAHQSATSSPAWSACKEFSEDEESLYETPDISMDKDTFRKYHQRRRSSPSHVHFLPPSKLTEIAASLSDNQHQQIHNLSKESIAKDDHSIDTTNSYEDESTSSYGDFRSAADMEAPYFQAPPLPLRNTPCVTPTIRDDHIYVNID